MADKLTTVYDPTGQALDVSAARAETLLARFGWSDTAPAPEVEDEGEPDGEPETPAEKPTAPKK